MLYLCFCHFSSTSGLSLPSPLYMPNLTPINKVLHGKQTKKHTCFLFQTHQFTGTSHSFIYSLSHSQTNRAIDTIMVAKHQACQKDDAEFAHGVLMAQSCLGMPTDTPCKFLEKEALFIGAARSHHRHFRGVQRRDVLPSTSPGPLSREPAP